MPTAAESSHVAIIEPNSIAAIRERVADGRISWAGPLLLVIARSFLLIASQALLALFLFLRHWQSPWREAGHYWNVYGTLVDIGCLIGLRYFTRREGIRLRDLVGPIRLRHGRDVLLGVGYCVWFFRSFLPEESSRTNCSMAPLPQIPGRILCSRITSRCGHSSTA